MQADGLIVSDRVDDRGVMAVAPDRFVDEFETLRARCGDLPIVAAGMIGSNRGLRETPYCAAPASLGDLAAAAVEVLDRVHLVPGISLSGAGGPDVMRGEEVQVLGAQNAGLVDGAALFCQPGTHNKWIETDGQRIVSFATAMTGELFALLKSHSILSAMLTAEVCDGPAFREGLARGADERDLPTSLFQARAAVLLGERPAEETASYVSGILIGADVGSRERLSQREVFLLSAGSLADLYAVAIGQAGGTVRPLDAKTAFAAGIHAIRTQLS
ncbi:2-oxo-3-deoxygalactonate kinase [Alteriqipengyuania lutimaris]|uniref:2-oxo-3-deoxygalactonate kinase n=2 Tax=Alteriqipengyuania lutimaris TaxID=1538146 RepID=A0A395LFV0_9SPHN|nr:2-oxo-3-deoxygalactonate kinase [Alteriqipengyuania lutimaris]